MRDDAVSRPRRGARRPSGPAAARSGPALALALAAGTIAAACGGDGTSGETGDATAPADSAQLMADRLMEALGGEEAWERARYIAFRWVVARGEEPFGRSHAWDRHDGRYRLEFGEGEDAVLALFDVNEVRRDSAWGKVPSGDIWVGGRKLSGAPRDSALARAYGTFVNDTYWLLMPFKWRDPGVHLSYEGRQMLNDRHEYAVVHLTFEPDLGVTNDEYWAYVDPETGIMAAWKYHLQDREEPGPLIWWRNWRRVGPIMLSADRVWPDGERNLYFEDLEAGTEVPEGVFAAPDAP